MKRDLSRLVDRTFDVIVIGGGVHGACVARDAALRGLSVALLEQGDFGHATSANSLKILHGGLRYVRDANLRRVRAMIEERAAWVRVAPHLVRVLPFVMPTFGPLPSGRLALSLAMAIADRMASGHEAGFPPGQIISRVECLRLLPGLSPHGVTGGAVWHDAQILNSERLLLSLVLSAAENGAEVANYLRVTALLVERRKVGGVRASDVPSGQEMEIRGRVVVNSTGAWTDAVLQSLNGRPRAPRFPLSAAVNLVTRQILPDVAVGLPATLEGSGGVRNGHAVRQTLFIIPWRERSLIGTMHQAYAGAPEAYEAPGALIEAMLGAVNRAYPPARLRRSDVHRVQAGFLPAASGRASAARVRLMREGRVVDHSREDHIGGLITVVGVKYTTARKVAESVVDLAVEHLGIRPRSCQTRSIPVWGGQIDWVGDLPAQALAAGRPGLGPETLDRLIRTYGSEYRRILEHVEANPEWGLPLSPTTPVLRAEVVHAVRAEMACTLADLVLRRTELGAAGPPDASALRACAELMAAELGWGPARVNQEIAAVLATLPSAHPGIHEGHEVHEGRPKDLVSLRVLRG